MNKQSETKIQEFQRALFDRVMWHDVDEKEVKRVFYSDQLAFKQLISGLETQSPLGTFVIYRLKGSN